MCGGKACWEARWDSVWWEGVVGGDPRGGRSTRRRTCVAHLEDEIESGGALLCLQPRVQPRRAKVVEINIEAARGQASAGERWERVRERVCEGVLGRMEGQGEDRLAPTIWAWRERRAEREGCHVPVCARVGWGGPGARGGAGRAHASSLVYW